jgi:hypothetical protein
MQTFSNNSLVKQVKDANQDFEFYPTTLAIADAIYKHLDSNHNSILDIGAGNGNFFRLIEKIDAEKKVGNDRYSKRMGNKYAIEKSRILIDNMDKDIALVGTDFLTQTLLDKKVNVIFSNPPYSAAEQWAVKIIRESNCKHAFIVMPKSKWEKSGLIKSAIKAREAEIECIFEYDYRESEFRPARTVVGIYKINFFCVDRSWGYSESIKVDPFDLWFDENFKIDESITSGNEYEMERQEKEEFSKKVHHLVGGRNLIEKLEVLYNDDLDTIQESYKSISKIPCELLKELNINKEAVKKALKMKLSGTKNLYWKELFKNLEVITSKLTCKSRKKIEEKLTSSTNVDFTAGNAYAVVCWVLKNANSYFDEQLIEVYKDLTSLDNITPYKSNHRFNTDDFRWNRHGEGVKKYRLDYRIIIDCYIQRDYDGKAYWIDDYHYADLRERIRDIFVIANNLGFNIPHPMYAFTDCTFGKKITIHDSDYNVFAEAKVYKKGTIHFKFCQDFMKAFNIEAGRLLGWLKSPQEAATELEIEPEKCLKFFKSNISLDNSNIKLLN